MNLDLAYVALLVAGYLALLFSIAYATEKKLIPQKISRHPAVYVLSLGATALLSGKKCIIGID